MPEEYTQDQIENAKAQATFCVANGHLVPNKCGSILLSALSTSERERDEAVGLLREAARAIPADLRDTPLVRCIDSFIYSHPLTDDRKASTLSDKEG